MFRRAFERAISKVLGELANSSTTTCTFMNVRVIPVCVCVCVYVCVCVRVRVRVLVRARVRIFVQMWGVSHDEAVPGHEYRARLERAYQSASSGIW